MHSEAKRSVLLGVVLVSLALTIAEVITALL